jgi:integrase
MKGFLTARAGEIFNLKWIDINSENRIVNITPEKGGEPRVLKISNRLIAMLNTLPKEIAFSHYKCMDSLTRCFKISRKKVAHKLGNPRMLISPSTP